MLIKKILKKLRNLKVAHIFVNIIKISKPVNMKKNKNPLLDLYRLLRP